MEEAHGLFAAALPASDDSEVGDDLSLVFLVTKLLENRECLLEVFDRRRVGAALGKCQGEVVERQRLGMPVADAAEDPQRDAVLLCSPLGVAFAAKLCSSLIEPERLPPGILPKGSSGERRHPVEGGGVQLSAAV